VNLANLTTLRLGGPAEDYQAVTSTDAIIDAVRGCDAAGRGLLVLGGGSNLVVADEGFAGSVVHVLSKGWTLESEDGAGSVTVRVTAGQPWDDFVAHAVRVGWVGVEALSGIPGSTGATPVQNVGAYGQEVAQTVVAVRAWDRQQNRVLTLSAADCEFGYRHSRFKEERFRNGPRFVVLEVTFRLGVGDRSAPVRYTELAARAGVAPGERADLALVRELVLELRRSKGMVSDPDDPDSWSAGSFFTNPVVDADLAVGLPDGAPRWPVAGGRLKLSAAWLIERAGFTRGYGLPGSVSLSTKHTLALTHRGGGSAAELLSLARTVRDGVRDRFGIELVPEPTLVGCAL